jgi:hypothetical protein
MNPALFRNQALVLFDGFPRISSSSSMSSAVGTALGSVISSHPSSVVTVICLGARRIRDMVGEDRVGGLEEGGEFSSFAVFVGWA